MDAKESENFLRIITKRLTDYLWLVEWDSVDELLHIFKNKLTKL